MLKAIIAPVSDAAAEDTQEETVSSEEHVKVMTAFEEFQRKKKVNRQSDVQALGQLVLLLMKHTDLNKASDKVSEQLADLVQKCSFSFTQWDQVLTHPVF